MGYRVRIEETSSDENVTGTNLPANFTLPPESNSLVMNNLSMGSSYLISVAAYNRQGIGPFSESVELSVDPDVFKAMDTEDEEDFVPPPRPDLELPPPPQSSPPERAPGFELVVQV